MSSRPFAKDSLGRIFLLKKLLVALFGAVTHPCLTLLNRFSVEGTQYIRHLDQTNVLVVSNHQTYYWDAIAMLHVLSSVKWGFADSIANPVYLLSPRADVSYVAARETMKSRLIARVMAYTGSISIDRAWRSGNAEVVRQVSLSDYANIGRALSEGWVITFPQGTTKPFAEVRRGIYHVITRFRPTVVPVVLDGFSSSFKRNGIRPVRRNVRLSVRIKPPLEIHDGETAGTVLRRIADGIEQTESSGNLPRRS